MIKSIKTKLKSTPALWAQRGFPVGLGFGFPHLFTGLAASVMTPAGGTEKVEPFLLPADVFTGKIFTDVVPFVKNNMDRVCLFGLFGEPVFCGLVFIFRELGLEGAK